MYKTKLDIKIEYMRNIGFTKGFKWISWLRITSFIGMAFSLMNLITFEIQSGVPLPTISLIIWLAEIVILIFYAIGLFKLNSFSYRCILIYFAVVPILGIASTEYTHYYYTKEILVGNYLLPQILTNIIYCCPNIYYFIKRKKMFEYSANDIINTANEDYMTKILHDSPKDNIQIQDSRQKRFNSNNLLLVLLSIVIIVLLATNIFAFYLYNDMLAKNNTLTEEVDALESDLKQADAAKIIENASMNNLLKEIRQHAGSVTSGTNDFKLLRCVMVLDKGSSMQSQIYANFTSTVSAEASNSKINFEFNDDEVDEYLNFKVTGVNLGCSTLTFTNDYNDDTATMLVIVK